MHRYDNSKHLAKCYLKTMSFHYTFKVIQVWDLLWMQVAADATALGAGKCPVPIEIQFGYYNLQKSLANRKRGALPLCKNSVK